MEEGSYEQLLRVDFIMALILEPIDAFLEARLGAEKQPNICVI